ncbi:phosphatase PAP2 family protein [Schlesneria paludicola]|uniref:phosphatase PAP2 family protein n=1 Tax=Schlesneria paludicola TaxID=360056 RepID=UPI00029A30BB|nr:phosphatase PAP2 family protein [Schlesneria paludicola]
MSALPREFSNHDSKSSPTLPDESNLSLFDPDANSIVSPIGQADCVKERQADGQLRQPRWPIWIPLIGALLFSVMIRTYDLDRKIAALTYNAADNIWTLQRAEPLLSFYRYGIFPPLLVGTVGALALICGRWIWRDADVTRLQTLRRGGLFLLLLLAIGPGLLVNTGLKMMWGRPRPLQCQDFGGEFAFHLVGDWSTYDLPNSSFPSGHASIAFFLMGPAFIINPKQTRMRRYWLLGGLSYGLAMGVTRVLQGGHFLSDVLWAGIIVYFVAVALAWLLIRFD